MKSTFVLLLIATLALGQDKVPDKGYMFKSGITPFLNDSKFGTLTLGMNYGSPTVMLDEWEIPDYNKAILFTHYVYAVSIYRFNLSIGQIQGKSLLYNWNPNGDKYVEKLTLFDAGYKILESKSYWPDIALHFNTNSNGREDAYFCFTPTIGSSRNKFKYYSSFSFFLYYLEPYPTNFQIGLSYEFIKNIEGVMEGNISLYEDKTESITAGLNYKPIKYVDIAASIYFARIDPTSSLVYRDNPRIKRDFLLFSGGITFHLWPKNN
jgi:hypothetical protein